MPDDESVAVVLTAMRKQIPEASEREARMLLFIRSAWGYVPSILTNFTTNENIPQAFNEWLTETYGLTISTPEEQPRKRRAHSRGGAR